MAELEGLLINNGEQSAAYRPQFFRLPGQTQELAGLLKTTPKVRVHDQILAQLKELMKSLNPAIRFTPDSLQEAIAKHLGNKPLSEYGVWVYYPWSQTLVHLLDQEEFALVRTDRNRNKITREEQVVLGTKKIGVIGLSVGQSVSLTMALERTFGEIRLADFDTLDLSNLNRIRSGTHNLGQNKAVITAREIAEIDPFLHVVCFTDGLTVENMDSFFTDGGTLDLLVEECDSVDIKILARQKAKALGIPVVMDMSDRGCLDVERFDLEPDRPIMHGWIDHLDLEAASRPMSAEEKVPYMLPITGMETLSPRMKASVIELGQTISTWPQLATSVVLGGALTGDVVRRIALDQFHASGRWHVDLDELIADQAPPAAPSQVGPPQQEAPLPPPDAVDLQLGPARPGAVELEQALVGQLTEAGCRAPSAGNWQPWHYAWHGRRLFLYHDKGRSRSFWDPDQESAFLGLGASVENVVQKAHSMGLEVAISLLPLGTGHPLVGVFEFHYGAVEGAEPHTATNLAAYIDKRHTNRSLGLAKPLDVDAVAAIRAQLDMDPQYQGHWLQAPEDMQRLAALYAQAERIRLMHPEGHREHFVRVLRWTREEALRQGNGVDIAGYALPPMAEAALKVMSDPRAMDLTRSWNGGQGLGLLPAWAIGSSPAAVLFTVDGAGPQRVMNAGRALQRAWLTATAHDIAVQPMSAMLQVTGKWAQDPAALAPLDQPLAEKMQAQLADLFQLDGQHPLLLLRLFNPSAPATRSHRHNPASTQAVQIPQKA
ncbi:MAG TPA: Rv1355c family protein [Flavobacteriales bacterium]|nr:Rv1355c family protein [Flavobacteriales bacterium]